MSSLSASAAASILLLTTLAAATVSASVSTTASDHRDGGVNTTAAMVTNNGSSVTTTTTSGENWDMYYCFLCTERHPLLIHYCPIYWDECHLNCWDDPPPSSPVQGKECYVMKLYTSGYYVIVERRTCDGIGSCFLTCGGGELMGTTTTTRTVPATIQAGSFVPPFEMCNTEVN